MIKYLIAFLILAASWTQGADVVLGNTTDNIVWRSEGGNNVSARFVTGGTITTDGTNWIHTFTSSGAFVVNGGSLVCDVLVVAGGGGGVGGVSGVNYGSGGGGGTVLAKASYTVSSGSITVTVGDTSGAGASGNNSAFGTNIATGGTAVANVSRTGGANANYIGGTASSGTDSGAGAGGGQNGSVSTAGNGYLSSISGTATYYAGGGGAIVSNVGISGGLGGGGAGNESGGGTSGTSNTGGGGGGGIVDTTSTGGSGIVIVRYLK